MLFLVWIFESAEFEKFFLSNRTLAKSYQGIKDVYVVEGKPKKCDVVGKAFFS